MQYFILDQNAENGTYARKFHTMDAFCLRVKKTQVFCHDYRKTHLPYKLFVALDLLSRSLRGVLAKSNA